MFAHNNSNNKITLSGCCVLFVLFAATNQGANCLLKPHSGDSSSSSPNANSEVCLQKATQMDKCLPKLVVYGDRNFDPPRTEQKLDDHCKMIDDNLKCVSSYSRECLPAFARNLYSVVTRRLKTQFAKRCKSKDGRRGKYFFLSEPPCRMDLHRHPHRHKKTYLERIILPWVTTHRLYQFDGMRGSASHGAGPQVHGFVCGPS